MWFGEAKAAMDIPLIISETETYIIKEGETITVTKGRNEKYTLWCRGV